MGGTMTVVYVTGPALLALVVLACTYGASTRLRPWPLAVRVSLWLGAGQGLYVAFSAWQTFEMAISSVACLSAIFGFMGMSVLAALDGLGLLWWLWSRREDGAWAAPVLFVGLRAVAHGLLIAALMWHAALCTV